MTNKTSEAAERYCACGNIDGANAECERCRLIALLRDIRQFCCDSQLVALKPIVEKIDGELSRKVQP